MVLESKWADAPDDTRQVSGPKKNIDRKRSPTKQKSKTPKDDKPFRKKRTDKPKDLAGPEKPQLVFSLKDKQHVRDKVDTKEPTSGDKIELLKKKIEEQKRILQKNQHERQQKELLENFLNGDDKFEWTDEAEEEEILKKLNKSLKL